MGTVIDATGAVVAEAGVELANVATGVKNTAKTDSTGAYRFKQRAGRHLLDHGNGCGFYNHGTERRSG